MKIISIKYKLTLVMVSVIIALMLALALINAFFLEKYYVFVLKDDFEESAKMIQEKYQTIDRELLAYMKEQNNLTGHKYEIVDLKGTVLMSSVPEYKIGQSYTLPENHKKYLLENVDEVQRGKTQYFVMTHADESKDQLMMYSSYDATSVLIISSALNNVKSNADIALQFFLITGIGSSFLVMIISLVLSNRLVKPIVMLNEQTEKIAHYDFDIKMMKPSNDEIGQLSKNIMKVAGALDEKIETLNEMNESLQNDMVNQRAFLASIAHEFKSPIGIIKGYTESVKLNYYKDEIEKNTYLDYVLEESDRLTVLVEDIVMLAKLDQRDFQLSLRTVDLKKLLERQVEKYRSVGAVRKVLIRSNLEQGKISGDLIRIEQIFENLIGNACHYTIEDSEISISLTHKGSHLQVVVSNPCETMDSKQLKLLINPFYRLETSRSRETGGHGLGLAIVDSLVRAHKGELLLNYEGGVFSAIVTFKEL